jgi:hypothetical protein
VALVAGGNGRRLMFTRPALRAMQEDMGEVGDGAQCRRAQVEPPPLPRLGAASSGRQRARAEARQLAAEVGRGWTATELGRRWSWGRCGVGREEMRLFIFLDI